MGVYNWQLDICTDSAEEIQLKGSAMLYSLTDLYESISQLAAPVHNRQVPRGYNLHLHRGRHVSP